MPKKHISNNVTIDDIEGELARVEIEAGQTRDIPLTDLPLGVQEGDILVRREDGAWQKDGERTRQVQKNSQEALEDLNTDAPSGEIDL